MDLGFCGEVIEVLRNTAGADYVISQLTSQLLKRRVDIAGIGKGLAAVLAEICAHQSCERRDTLLANTVRFAQGLRGGLSARPLDPPRHGGRVRFDRQC